MCLINSTKFPFFAQKDITVYKVVNSSNFTGRKHYYPNTRYNGPELARDTTQINVAFHSYSTLEIAKGIGGGKGEGKVVEFTIPRGTLYYRGYHNNRSARGYASQDITSGSLTPARAKRVPSAKRATYSTLGPRRDANGRFC